jgi:hypothetical protein
MSEKLAVVIVSAAGILPICAVCILGPAAIGSLFAGAAGWLGGFGPLVTAALMIAAGVLVYRHILRRRTRALPDHEASADGQVQKPSQSIQG